MVVGLLTVELHVPGSQSLKDKRMVVRRIKDRLKKFNVAVSEVDHHDLWQRAALAVVTVSTDEKHADRQLAAVADEIEPVEPGVITRTEDEFLTWLCCSGSRHATRTVDADVADDVRGRSHPRGHHQASAALEDLRWLKDRARLALLIRFGAKSPRCWRARCTIRASGS